MLTLLPFIRWSNLARIMTNVVLNCHSCGEQFPLNPGDKILRKDTCHQCGMYMHCCRNCRLFDPSKNNQCAEPQAEWVSDKEGANFCDFFEPRTSVNLVNRSRSASESTAKAFDSLFKKG